MLKVENGIIEITEKFTSLGIKSLDSKDRIVLGGKVKKTLSKKMRVDAFEILVGEDGDVLLRPVASIPSREAWIHKNPKALKQIVRGLKEAKKGQIEKVVDLNEFTHRL